MSVTTIPGRWRNDSKYRLQRRWTTMRYPTTANSRITATDITATYGHSFVFFVFAGADCPSRQVWSTGRPGSNTLKSSCLKELISVPSNSSNRSSDFRNTCRNSIGAEPLTHYLTSGAAEGRSPSPWFDIAHYVAISAANRHPDLHYAATIHHGVEVSDFTFVPSRGDYLLFLGRIHPHKGTHLAVEVARRTGMPLVIAGIVQDEDYFRDAVRPHVDGIRVSYAGPVGPLERDALLGGAGALLHLISFAEPFGLSVVEALATGTPVIATPLGSMPELVRDGATGFLVADVDEAVRAVGRLGEIERSTCRADAVARFSADRMVDEHLAVFERIVSRGPGQ